MPYPLPLTRTEAYLAYKAGVIQQSDLKPSLAVPRNGIDAWLAYWTGLAADYPKREDGTPHILQEEEAYIAYLCGVLNEYPEKCLRRVGAYLRYLISARWGRPDHPLNREELYLSLIKTQFIPSGDPSSDIEIDGTAKAPFVDVKMYGDTFQQSYTGKNLWDMSADNRTDWNANLTEDEDGWITGTGYNGFYNFWTKPNLKLEPDATYYYVLEVADVYAANSNDRLQITSESSSTSNNCQFTESVNILLNTLQAGGVYAGAITTKSSFSGNNTMLRSFLRPYNTASRIKFRLSIVKEQPDTANFVYEPFVGGTPSPNPEYPQPIQTVTGRQVVKVEGKNLLNIQDNLKASDYSGLVFSYVNNEITANGTPTRGWANVTRGISVSLPAGQYTLSLSKQLTHRVYLHVAYTDATEADEFVINAGATSKTVTLAKDVSAIRLDFSMMATGVALDESFSIQLEAGSTATTYEPYSSNDYEINLGKNLFDKYKALDNYFYTSTGSISTYSKPQFYNNKFFPTSNKITMSFSACHDRQNGSNIEANVRIVQYDASGNFISRLMSRTNGHTFTLDANTKSFILCVDNGPDAWFDDLQIEYGSTATQYAPYFEPIELCKLGDYQDYIWKDNGDWKVHKATDKVILTGGEQWSGNDISEGFFYTYTSSYDTIIQFNTVAGRSSVADFYDGVLILGTSVSKSVFSLRSSWATDPVHLRFKLPTQMVSSRQEWVSYLRSHETIVYYTLATATDTVITDQTLITQLEALVNGGAEDGTTYIKVSATDPNLPAKLYVEAPKYE